MKQLALLLTIPLSLILACGGDGDDGNTSASTSSTNGTTTSQSAGGGGSGAGGSGGAAAGSCDGIEAKRNLLTPEELLAMLDNKDFELVNVHIPYAGEITGTDAHLPYNDVDAIEGHLKHESGAKTVLYCLTGPMSKIAGDELVKRGYCRVYDMPAGLYQWQQLGYPSSD